MHGQEIAAKIIFKQEGREYGRGKISSWREAKIRMKKKRIKKGGKDSKTR
jgi:dsRNA-specific ribonuclease